jgi:protein phosphatase
VRAGDVYFLCSDGMTNYVEDSQILQVAMSDADWQEKLRQLVNMALESGGSDNITALFAVPEEAANR